ncbi:hypothetical protein GUJ93_ZPchr0005g16180 [Zizania palustris]|uniref:DUF569 domain-containing protein n=1 Tax=Zizania palustris TaxID=103762 RepID=A0A8J5SAN7_ZIZPA|nr:hypothetical protein GUJ93_ZPchr0005g16180 [Zizania palustris]
MVKTQSKVENTLKRHELFIAESEPLILYPTPHGSALEYYSTPLPFVLPPNEFLRIRLPQIKKHRPVLGFLGLLRAAAMEFFENARSVRLKSHLGTYLYAMDDGGGETVSHGYRRNCRGTVWAVETAGEDYIRLLGQRGLYLCATELPAALDGRRGSAACCRVIQGLPSTPNDGAFLWTPRRDGEHLTLTGLYGRLLRARFGQTPQENAVTVDREVVPDECSWVVEVVPEEAAPPMTPRPLPCRAHSCDARLEATKSDTASSAFVRFYSAKELKTKPDDPPCRPVARTIFYNTARDDGSVDDFDEGTWKFFTFSDQSLAALCRRLEEETQRHDFVVCRRRGAAPQLFPVVLDLPPGNRDMEFILVLKSSKGNSS